ncbi:hypothetical protein [Paenibacillus uliginis]|uniref:hypothetical protein n=1 Tax=Paenibacillus uliginis TaxID=683737 RepID=UPI001FCE07B2|nr:hypothetical protein [Paenibacillus uliginis]
MPVPPTASVWGTYKVATGQLTETLTGVHDVYLVLTNTYGKDCCRRTRTYMHTKSRISRLF